MNRRKKMADEKEPPTARFTQNTKEFKALEKLMKDGHITASDKPGDIRKTDSQFQKYTPQQFCSQFNKLKSIYGLCTRDGMYDACFFTWCVPKERVRPTPDSTPDYTFDRTPSPEPRTPEPSVSSYTGSIDGPGVKKAEAMAAGDEKSARLRKDPLSLFGMMMTMMTFLMQWSSRNQKLIQILLGMTLEATGNHTALMQYTKTKWAYAVSLCCFLLQEELHRMEIRMVWRFPVLMMATLLCSPKSGISIYSTLTTSTGSTRSRKMNPMICLT